MDGRVFTGLLYLMFILTSGIICFYTADFEENMFSYIICS